MQQIILQIEAIYKKIKCVEGQFILKTWLTFGNTLYIIGHIIYSAFPNVSHVFKMKCPLTHFIFGTMRKYCHRTKNNCVGEYFL